MAKIIKIEAKEIVDSKKNLAIEVELTTDKGIFFSSVSSELSKGKHEAAEILEKDKRGISTEIKNINTVLFSNLKGKNPTDQKGLDFLMIAFDGEKNKSKLGANSLLPVSMAICRAGAAARKLHLYEYIHSISNSSAPSSLSKGLKSKISNLAVPLPMFNFIEGKTHSDGANKLDFQEFMAVLQRKSFRENLAIANKIFNSLKETLQKSYGNDLKIGDEGGFTPQITKTEQALFLLKNAIGGQSAKISIDAAASQFYKEGKYFLEGQEFSRLTLVEFYKNLVHNFPILSIEDPFADDDWEGFREIIKALPGTIIVGDDLTATNTQRIKEAHNKKSCNGIVVKPNQAGTITGTIEAAKLAKSFGWKVIVSQCSAETTDDFVFDLAVGVGADFVKFGSPAQTESMVKYNRLLEIENELHKK